ncbi:molybdopterin-dependent oxidoreductase [Ilumatobacter nonamiensis]|uniref:molybdopterin-dependent oxidoreductase n=1 Tax=Ilumatobacter nonamiensis TaxID=467093 RepID=UPI00068482C7|nr:molybdopterin-dependent oxidoreductase [Ilumatobacter nonamiensis]
MSNGPYDADEPVGQPGRVARLRNSFSSDATTPSLWRGLGLGLLATGAGLGVAELVVGLVQDSASPVVPVGQEFIDYTPAWLKNWAIEQFGTNDKAVLVAGALIVILILGAIIGVLAVRGARAMAYALTIAVGVIGACAVMIRPEPSLAKLLPTIVGALVSLGVLWWLAPRPGPADETGRPTMIGPDRRQFMLGAVGIGSVAAITGGLGWTMRRRFEIDQERAELVLPRVEGNEASAVVPDEFSLGVDGIESFVVPNDDFYRIDTALVVPQVSIETWSLKIGGLVDNPMELTFSDLLARPQIERTITLSCVSNPVGGDLVGNAVWQGVRLADLLEEAGLQTGAEQVVSRSVDGWTCGSPIEAIMDGRDAMLAVAMNGEPLPAQHGYPVRIVVPGLFGYVSATKWVTDITLTRWDEFDAYWVPRGWSKRGPVKTMARIDTPRSGARRDGEVPIGGVAWAVHRGVEAVQVRIDEGEWRDAELGAVPSADTWVQWVYRWDTSEVERGGHSVEVRAIDGEGEPQPEQPKAVAPDGAQGYHRISIDVG